MGRRPDKAAGNVWFEARKEAAKYDERLQSREGAAELLGMSRSSVAEAELGLTKFMPVDKAVQMADTYHAPQLLNYYCIHECPIGCKRALTDEIVSIERVTVKLLKSLSVDQLAEIKKKLIDIAADGIKSDEEERNLICVLEYLKELATTISQIEIVAEIALHQRRRNNRGHREQSD